MILTVEVDIFGIMEENTYFFIDDETDSGFLIDPGAEAEKLLQIAADKKFTIEKILLTHGHYDHIGAVNEIRRALNIPVCMGRGGNFYARDPISNGSRFFNQEIILDDVTILDDAAEIFLSANPNFKVKVIAAPGHTLDGTIYYSEKNSVAFVGDTIFYGGHGRTDLAGGSEIDLMNTIKNKVFTLPDETILFCGHGRETTVAEEKYRAWYT
ncbi:MAG: MBL fold metallo-hydrolase [Selenomonadaceae bacterium]|nr:MBL fold metallo-hydrolase [Selenomonadaceae bacterium]